MQLKSLLIGSSLLFAAPAFAQGDGDTPADPAVGAEVGAEVGVGGEVTPPVVDASANVLVGVWPLSIIDRPYVRPKGKITVGGDLSLGRVSFFNPVTMMSESSTGVGMHLGGAYGVTDKINAGLDYSFSIEEFEIKGPLSIWGGFQILHDVKMSVAATASFTVDLDGPPDLMGDATVTKQINAGLGARYNIKPNMTLFTGNPIAPGNVGQHLTISLEDKGAISFDLPIGFGFQATPELFAYGATNLATIYFTNGPPSGTMGETTSLTLIGADITPLQLGAMFSMSPQLDVGGALIFPSVEDIADVFAIQVSARLHM